MSFGTGMPYLGRGRGSSAGAVIVAVGFGPVVAVGADDFTVSDALALDELEVNAVALAVADSDALAVAVAVADAVADAVAVVLADADALALFFALADPAPLSSPPHPAATTPMARVAATSAPETPQNRQEDSVILM